MAKLELPFLARASVTLLLLLCLFFTLVGVFTAYWGILSIDNLSAPAPVTQQVYYLGVWLPLDQSALAYLNAQQQAAKAFAIFSIIGSLLITILFIGLAFAPSRWVPAKFAKHLPMGTLIATAVTCFMQLLLWSLMAGLYNRWRYALEANAAASSAIQSYGLLGFSFALVIMANIGQLAALPAVYAIVKLEATSALSAASAASKAAPPRTPATRIDQLAAAAAAENGGGNSNVRFHRTRPPPPLPPLELPPSPMPIRVIEASASPPVATTDIDAEVNLAGVDNHSVENEEMLERLHRNTSTMARASGGGLGGGSQLPTGGREMAADEV